MNLTKNHSIKTINKYLLTYKKILEVVTKKVQKINRAPGEEKIVTEYRVYNLKDNDLIDTFETKSELVKYINNLRFLEFGESR